jgi:hypothetical protein
MDTEAITGTGYTAPPLCVAVRDASGFAWVWTRNGWGTVSFVPHRYHGDPLDGRLRGN